MKTYFNIFTAGALLCCTLFITCASSPDNRGNTPVPDAIAARSDTGKITLQQVIDSTYKIIAAYSSLLYQENRLKESIDSIALAIKGIDTAIKKQENFDINKICTPEKLKSSPATVKKELRQIYAAVFQLEEAKRKMLNDIKLRQDELLKTAIQLRQQQPIAEDALKKIKTATDSLSGAVGIRFNNRPFRIFIAGKGIHHVYVHNGKDGDASFKEVKKMVQKQKTDSVLMMMNGGMYNADFQPQGLLISGGKLIAPADSVNTKQSGNFYMYPNGIFLIDSAGNFRILETQEYIKLYKKNKPFYATQSGPMLVNNKSLHHQFTPASPNLNIRNGVGEMSNDKVIFLISDEPVNFFDFALIFRYYFNCSNALYLDGAISKMYLSGDKQLPDEKFGPIITVLKKQPKK
jgi:uncharacterized protein YigE (DUF2233 family)